MDQEIKTKVLGFLGFQKSRLGVVSTVNKDGSPASAAVYFAFDPDMNIYFATRDGSRKYVNIFHNKNVAFTIFTENPPQTLQIEGEASVHSNVDDQKHLYEDLIALASSKNFSAPISEQTKAGGIQFIKITPYWIRFGNFEVRKHGNTFEEIKS